MKFIKFTEFKAILGETAADYLSREFKLILRDLQVGLTRLKFTDNFESFKVTVSIDAGAELAIRNELRSGEIPTERLIVRSDSSDIVDGDTAWTKDFVYLKNTGVSQARLTVIFLK